MLLVSSLTSGRDFRPVMQGKILPGEDASLRQCQVFQTIPEVFYQVEASADPFAADTNHDGIPDGEQLDADLDGTADAKDMDAADATATLPLGPAARYALFPITNAQPFAGLPEPIQINDQGTVLYNSGTWTGGVWTALGGTFNEPDQKIFAARINDGGEILGVETTGRFDAGGGHLPGNLLHAESPGGMLAPLVVAGAHPWSEALQFSPGRINGIRFSNNGEFLGEESSLAGGGGSLTRSGHFLWTVPKPGRAGGKVPVMVEAGGVSDADLFWGTLVGTSSPSPAQALFANGQMIFAPGQIRDAYWGTGGEIIATFENGLETQVHHQGAWHPSPAYANASGLSSDGTAIGKNQSSWQQAPIYLNGDWTDIRRAAPGLTGGWGDATTDLLDTTPSGWILAGRGDYTARHHAVMLPVSVEGSFSLESLPGSTSRKEAGVDDVSIRSSLPGEEAGDRIWIMAPLGGGLKSVDFDTPIKGGHSVELTAPGIDFGGAEGKGTVSANSSALNLQATPGSASGTSLPVKLTVGGVESLSSPLGVKVMKARTVKVTLYKVTKQVPGEADNTADQTPDAESLRKYLNDIFRPQLNVTFEIAYAAAPLALNWGDTYLDTDLQVTAEQQLILNARPNPRPASDIDVFLLGTEKLIDATAWAATTRTPESTSAGGPGGNFCWVVGDALQGRTMFKLWQTIAHEIGHVLVGFGHPDDGTGRAPLPGTRHLDRLMVGGKSVLTYRGSLLVKAEWDAAEEWLKREIDGGPNP